MEWAQVAAWVVWAWVGFSTYVSLSLILLAHRSEEEMLITVSIATWTLQAILGLLLIQTLGLTV